MVEEHEKTLAELEAEALYWEMRMHRISKEIVIEVERINNKLKEVLYDRPNT